jgi:hypothetical protein
MTKGQAGSQEACPLCNRASGVANSNATVTTQEMEDPQYLPRIPS